MPGKRKNTPKSVIVVVIATIVVCLLLVASICFCLRRQRRKGRKDNNEWAMQDGITSSETSQLAYNDIKDATENFAEVNKLGRGGFGTMYKGVLANKQVITVKRLASSSVQGEVKFRTKVLLVAKLQHRNLVRLLGFCLAGDERLLYTSSCPTQALIISCLVKRISWCGIFFLSFLNFQVIIDAYKEDPRNPKYAYKVSPKRICSQTGLCTIDGTRGVR